jgi:hypothetical protein
MYNSLCVVRAGLLSVLPTTSATKRQVPSYGLPTTHKRFNVPLLSSKEPTSVLQRHYRMTGELCNAEQSWLWTMSRIIV